MFEPAEAYVPDTIYFGVLIWLMGSRIAHGQPSLYQLAISNSLGDISCRLHFFKIGFDKASCLGAEKRLVLEGGRFFAREPAQRRKSPRQLRESGGPTRWTLGFQPSAAGRLSGEARQTDAGEPD